MKKTIAKILAVITLSLNIATPTVYAASTDKHFEGSMKRTCGVDWLESCTSTFNWTVNSNWDITDSSGYQVPKGINVNKGGIDLKLNSDHERDYSAKTEEVIGLGFKGISIGFTRTLDDTACLMNGGQLYCMWDGIDY